MDSHEILEVIDAVVETITSKNMIGALQQTSRALRIAGENVNDGGRVQQYRAQRDALLETMRNVSPPTHFTPEQRSFFFALGAERMGARAAQEVERFMAGAFPAVNEAVNNLDTRAVALSTQLQGWREVAGAMRSAAHAEGAMVGGEDVTVTLITHRERELGSLDGWEAFASKWHRAFDVIGRLSSTNEVRLELRDVRRGSWVVIFAVTVSVTATGGGTAALAVRFVRALLDMYKTALEVRQIQADIELAKAQIQKTRIEGLDAIIEKLDKDPRREKRISELADACVARIGADLASQSDKNEARNGLLVVLKEVAGFVGRGGRLLASGGAAAPEVATESTELDEHIGRLEAGRRVLELTADASPSAQDGTENPPARVAAGSEPQADVKPGQANEPPEES